MQNPAASSATFAASATTSALVGKTLLLLEDEPELADTLAGWLRALGAEVVQQEDGQQALDWLATGPELHLALLDIMVPGVDGLGVLDRLRQSPHYAQLPILMLTAKTREDDEIRGLHGGADTYLKKPVRLPLLQAHLERLLRRVSDTDHPPEPTAGAEAPPELLNPLPGLQLDPRQHLALWQGRELALTPSEWAILHLLAQQPGRRYSRADILAELEDGDRPHFDRTVDAHIKNLRQKLEPDGALIRTYRGLGYGLDLDYRPHPPAADASAPAQSPNQP